MWYILGPWKRKKIGRELPLHVRRRAFETYPAPSVDSRTIYHLKSKRGTIYVVQWEPDESRNTNLKILEIGYPFHRINLRVIRLSAYFDGGDEDNYHVEFPSGSDKAGVCKALYKLIRLMENSK